MELVVVVVVVGRGDHHYCRRQKKKGWFPRFESDPQLKKDNVVRTESLKMERRLPPPPPSLRMRLLK